MLFSQFLKSSETLVLRSPFSSCDFIFCSSSDTIREYCGMCSTPTLPTSPPSPASPTSLPKGNLSAFLLPRVSSRAWQV